jgi:transposase
MIFPFHQEGGVRNINKIKETAEEENKRLRAENKLLKQERDILKKATAYFAKETL